MAYNTRGVQRQIQPLLSPRTMKGDQGERLRRGQGGIKDKERIAVIWGEIRNKAGIDQGRVKESGKKIGRSR